MNILFNVVILISIPITLVSHLKYTYMRFLIGNGNAYDVVRYVFHNKYQKRRVLKKKD